MLALVAAGLSAARLDAPSAALSTGRSAADCTPPHIGLGTGEGLNDPTQFPGATGELRMGMLFVDFADMRGESDPRALYDAFVPRAVEWYRTVSYDRLRLVVTPLPRWLSLRGTTADYAADERGLHQAVEEAIDAADADLDFSRFHAIYLVIPSRAQQTIGALGVLLSGQPIRVDGAEIRSWAWLFEEYPGHEADQYLTHETGHLLGLPDLYVVRSPKTFHSWDVMAFGFRPAGMFAWHRWKLGWLDPDQLACFTGRQSIRATVTPLERPGGTKAIVFRGSRSAYVAEVRQPIAEDAGICTKGVLIYRVDFRAPAGSADILLLRARPDGTARRCGPQGAAPFDIVRGKVSRVRAWGFRFELLAALPDGSYRIRATRTK